MSYIADGHVLSMLVSDGDARPVLICPGRGKCEAWLGYPADECNLLLWFGDDRQSFLEYQNPPYRAAEMPCEIEWYWTGFGEDAELWWRPIEPKQGGKTRTERLKAMITLARHETREDLVIDLLEEFLSDITDIKAQIDAYEQSVAGVFAAIDTALANFGTKVTALEAQIAAGAPPSATEVQGLKDDIAAAQALVAPEQAKVQAADPGAPPAPAKQSVYTFDGDPTTVDTTLWVITQEETTDVPPKRLYTYTGDTAPGDAKGDGIGGVWHHYTGPVQPLGGKAAETSPAGDAPAG